MAKCLVCNKEITYGRKCSECAKKSLQETFRQNPELREAYKEAVEETFSPENQKIMVDTTVKFIEAIKSLQRKRI